MSSWVEVAFNAIWISILLFVAGLTWFWLHDHDEPGTSKGDR